MKSNIQHQVGKRVKELRQKKGLTQEELADKTGIDYKYIQRIEGKTPPNLTAITIGKLAQALKVKPSKFFE